MFALNAMRFLAAFTLTRLDGRWTLHVMVRLDQLMDTEVPQDVPGPGFRSQSLR